MHVYADGGRPPRAAVPEKPPSEPAPAGNDALGHDFSAVTIHADRDETAGSRPATAGRRGTRRRGHATPDRTGTPVTREEAGRTLDAIVDIINQYVTGEGEDLSTAAAHPDVPARWRPLLDEWFMIANGTVRQPGGVLVRYRGDILTVHVDRAVAETAPLVRAMLADGDRETADWVEQQYTRKVAEFRARAAREAVTGLIEDTARRGSYGALDAEQLDDVAKLRVASVEGLKLTRALLTIATRTANANARQAKELDDLYARALGGQALPTSLATTRAMNIANGLSYVQGGLNLVQAIVDVADPQKRLDIYRHHQERFGPVAGYTQMLKNLTQFVSGSAAVGGAGTWAVASVLGKADLAAKALSLGTSALGRINVALNVFGVIHGIAVLCDDSATAAERADAAVETGSGALGLAGRFIPRLAPFAAAASASLLINYYTFKGLLEATAGAYSGLMTASLNMCFEYLRETAQSLSWTGMRYVAALDLAATTPRPDLALELAEQTTDLRSSLVWTITDFLRRAARGGRDADPGTHEILRRRFLPLQNGGLETPEQIVDATARLLGAITACFTDAQTIYQEQIEYSWAHH